MLTKDNGDCVSIFIEKDDFRLKFLSPSDNTQSLQSSAEYVDGAAWVKLILKKAMVTIHLSRGNSLTQVLSFQRSLSKYLPEVPADNAWSPLLLLLVDVVLVRRILAIFYTTGLTGLSNLKGNMCD